MVVIDWARVAAMGVLATALLTGWASIALLDAVLFVVNAGEVVFRSASQAMIPSVAPRARLERAAATWRVFNRATVAQAYAEPAPVA